MSWSSSRLFSHSMNFTFVHAADLHLDSPFRGLAGKSPVSAREATFRAFARVVDLCLAERVLFLALAGDLFDAKDRSVRARLFLRSQLERLDQAGVRTFIVHGNHDPLSGDNGLLKLPSSVKVFGPAWEEVIIEVAGERVCRVQGISYPHEAVQENLSRAFHRQGPELTVGLLHTNLAGESMHANYAPCSLEDLDAAGLDYWALGHVHTRALHALPGGGVAAYPGNTQGRHVAELGERGCWVVRVAEGKLEPRFVATDVLRWHRVAVDLSAAQTLDEVGPLVDAACSELGAGVDAHVVRLTLTGKGVLHAELARDGLSGLEEHLREELGRRAVPVVLEAVEDQTAADLDWEALEKGGLTGAVFEAARHPAAVAGLWGDPDLKRLDQLLRQAKVQSPRDDGLAPVEEAMRRVVEALVEGDA
jgi:exonuclease SbcD